MKRQPDREPTERQAEYLDFIRRYSEVHKQAPSEGDLARHFEVSAPSVHQMILTLETRGFLSRRPGQARAIEVLVAPSAGTSHEKSGSEGASTATVSGEWTGTVDAVMSVGAEVLRRLFAYVDRSPMDDAEFAPIVGCVVDGVDAGLREAGAPEEVAADVRGQLLRDALRNYTESCARNDPSGADEEEDADTFLYLMMHGEWPDA